MLTHSAGLTYDLWNPAVAKYRSKRGETPGTGATMETNFKYPMVYQPGTFWGYSSAIDWAGRIVEKLTSETLETYMQKNIWAPFVLLLRGTPWSIVNAATAACRWMLGRDDTETRRNGAKTRLSIPLKVALFGKRSLFMDREPTRYPLFEIAAPALSTCYYRRSTKRTSAVLKTCNYMS